MRQFRSPFRTLLDLRVPGLQVTANKDITKETSMRMRCTAGAFAEVTTLEGLDGLLTVVNREELPAFLLGRGQNTLFASSHFDGVVFKLGGEFKSVQNLGNNLIRAGAGLPLPRLQTFARENGLMGLEFLTRVPGTVGGALAGNAGAGNWGLCDFVERAFLLSRTGHPIIVHRNEFRHSYRFSELKDTVILFADLRLEPLHIGEHMRRVEEFTDKKKGQPYDQPSSGCIFKNPKLANGETVSAGKLIDAAGLKGYRIRSACISEQHANFMINEGSSSGEDFLALINLVRDIIKVRNEVDLHVEVQVVGGPLNSVVLR